MKFEKIIEKAKKTHKARNKEYNKNYIKFGKIADSIFPDGITIRGWKQWVKFGLFFMALVKMSRNAESFIQFRKFHEDSTHDMGVYSFMLEEVETELEDD
jgi:hypothetical protein